MAAPRRHSSAKDTQRRIEEESLEKTRGNAAANGQILLFNFLPMSNGTATAPHRDMAATESDIGPTVKERRRQERQSERRQKKMKCGGERSHTRDMAATGNDIGPTVKERKERHRSVSQRAQKAQHNRRGVCTRRGRAATIFKELLQLRKQGNFCTIFF